MHLGASEGSDAWLAVGNIANMISEKGPPIGDSAAAPVDRAGKCPPCMRGNLLNSDFDFLHRIAVSKWRFLAKTDCLPDTGVLNLEIILIITTRHRRYFPGAIETKFRTTRQIMGFRFLQNGFRRRANSRRTKSPDARLGARGFTGDLGGGPIISSVYI